MFDVVAGAQGQQAIFSLDQVVPGFTKGLTGAQAGERVLMMPGADGYDSSGGNPQASIQVGDSLVFLVDVLAVSTKTAVGTAATPTLPVTVGQDAAGTPTVTIPSGATPPAQLVAERDRRRAAPGRRLRLRPRALPQPIRGEPAR